jgi:hypothetical protein
LIEEERHQELLAVHGNQDDLRGKFNIARELVGAGEYDAARAILRRIDHPKARDWLHKIDEKERNVR